MIVSCRNIALVLTTVSIFAAIVNDATVGASAPAYSPNVQNADNGSLKSTIVEIQLVAVVDVSNIGGAEGNSASFKHEEHSLSQAASLGQLQQSNPAVVVVTSNPPSEIPEPIANGVITKTSDFDGLGFDDGTSNILDIQLGAGPDHVMEVVNVHGKIWTKEGVPITVFRLEPFFAAPGDLLVDPRLFFDSVGGRWFGSILDITTGSVRVAVSTASDPTGTWNIYDFPYGADSVGEPNLPDQPIIGSSDDKLVISANVHDADGTTFFGAQFYVADKLAMISGSLLVSSQFFSSSPVPNIDLIFSIHPMRSLASTAVLYMVSVNFGGFAPEPFRFYSVSGAVPNASVAVETLADIVLIPSPPAKQAGTDHLVPTGDARVLDAAWYNDKLWLSLNDACTPPDDTELRSCIHLIQLDTSTSPATISQDFDYGIAGFYLFYSALSMDDVGNLLVVFTYSSSNDYPSVAATGQAVTDPPHTVMQPLIIKSGLGFSPAGRWGDYFGASVDPSDRSHVWVAGEYQAASDDVVTDSHIARLQLVHPPPSHVPIVDFNGDDYADLAIGVPNEGINGQANAGSVNIIYGSAFGLSATSTPDQRFFQDYSVAGDPTSNIRDMSEVGDRFGAALAAGDFNNDGYTDLAIGVPGEDIGSVTDAGAVSAIYGSTSGLSPNNVVIANQVWTQGSPDVEDDVEAGDHFGASLVTGDFNKDGYADLVVGVPSESINGKADAGSVNVIYGSPEGLSATSTPNQRFFQDYSIPGDASSNIDDASEAGDNFGASLAAGDFNKDGYADLAVGVPNEDLGSSTAAIDAGAANVIYGSIAGLSTTAPTPDQFWNQDSSGVEGISGNNDHFGAALAAGDFNKDGYADLATGVPDDREEIVRDGETITSFGAINIIFGASSGLSATATIPDQIVFKPDLAVEGCLADIGRVLASGDFNGDGYADLAVGSPDSSGCSSSSTPGEARVLDGSAAGISTDSTLRMTGSPIVNEFGAALAAGDFNKDGFLDLAIGLPNWNTGSCSGAGGDCGIFPGAVEVRFGPHLGSASIQFWTQDSPDVEDIAEGGDRFGAAMGTG